MAPLNSNVFQAKLVQLPLKFPTAQGEEALKRPELVSSPSLEYSMEEMEKADLNKSEWLKIVCLPKSPTSTDCRIQQFEPKRCLEDNDVIGIQPSLDEACSSKKKKKKEAREISESAAVEHDDISNVTNLCFEWPTGPTAGFKSDTEHDIFPAKEKNIKDGVDHDVSLLLVDLSKHLSKPVQESSACLDSDTDEEESAPPAVIVIDSSEELAAEKIDEHPLEEGAVVKVDSEKTIKRPPRKRHFSGKLKRNIYLVVPDSPPINKKPKTRARYQPKKKARVTPKCRKESEEDLDSLISEFRERDAAAECGVTVRRTGRRSPRVCYNVPRDCTDSGVESGSFGSNEGSSGTSSSGSSAGGSALPGGGPDRSGNTGGGDSGDGNEEKGRVPIITIDDDDEDDDKEEDEDEEMEGEEHNKIEDQTDSKRMEVDIGQPALPDFDAVNGHVEMVDFNITDLQHGCYCMPGKKCPRINCDKVKKAVNHMQSHKKYMSCSYCATTRDVIKSHAAVCCLEGCRVPQCIELRARRVTPQPLAPPGVPQRIPTGNHQWLVPRPQYVTLPNMFAIDGLVLYKNSDLMGTHFQEHIDYHVQRSENIGKGSNGVIYKVLTKDRRHRWVVKETAYTISPEEINVYKAVGNHENIVKHHGVTFKGSSGKASVFMEECDQSLYDYLRAKGTFLPPDEAMYFWCQVLDAVVHMHNLQVPVIHKDIKAKNVLLCEEYTCAKLADFDSAKTLPDEFTESGLRPLGTPGFASPEVLRKEPHGTPADVHNMGCYLLEMTVGVPVKDTLPQKIEELRQLDGCLADLVTACVRASPAERPTAKQIKQLPVVRRYGTPHV